MNKNIIGIIVLILVLVGLSAILTKKDNAEPVAVLSESKISVTEQSYDFGDIEIFDGKVSTTYTLRNEGADPVIITSASTSCTCTEGEIAGMTFGMHGSDVKALVINPGDEEVVTATFDPLAHGPNGTGPITRILQLETNSEQTPQIDLRFSGNVIKTEE